ncbi:MAG: DUF3047 domain-containing protein [bacterium]
MNYKRKGFTLVAPVLLCVLLCLPLSLDAQDTAEIVFDFEGAPNKQGVPDPWKLKVKSGKSRVQVVKEANGSVARFVCEDASFSLQREIKIDTKKYPFLEWQWKAVRLPPNGDLRKSGTNDQALQILLAFSGNKILSYVWDTNAPEGTVGSESVPWPIGLSVKAVVVKSGTGEVGQWLVMKRNVYDDYRRLFGIEPGALQGLRVQTNCQHTGSTAEGHFGKISLSAAGR